MVSYDAALRDAWDRIDCHDGGALLIPLPHPLEWHVRYAGENQKSLVAVSDIAAGELPSSRAIEAACRQRRDGRYALSFTLLNRTEEDVFIAMAGDMIAFSSDAASPQRLCSVSCAGTLRGSGFSSADRADFWAFMRKRASSESCCF